MAFLVQENTNFPRIQFEHRPMLLKDFLKDDLASSHSRTTSSSSSSSRKSKVVAKSNKPHIVLLRSWSKRAAATKISAVHKVIKLLQFASSKSPSVLPRTISRKLTNKRGKNDDSDILVDVSEVEVKVKVKDILRWRSFRDLAEDDPMPLDFPPSPHRSTTTAAVTTTSCSKRSSWCDSDFTAEEFPPWGGENEDSSTLKNPKGDWSSFEEYEQQSPVSVLDSPFRQVQEFTHFHPILENIQSAKCDLTRRTQERSDKGEIAIYEEKARQLLSQVEVDDQRHNEEDDVMLDFFIDELSRNGKLDDDEFDCEILRVARSWMDGEFEESYEWEVEEERESFVKDMERGICWNKFEEEREELCEELEVRALNDLLDDLVTDFLC